MEVDLVESNPVRGGLGLAEPAEDLDREIAHGGRKTPAADGGGDLAEASLFPIPDGDADVDLRCCDAGSHDAPAAQLEPAAGERGERGAKAGVVGAEIDEGSEDHVAARAGECIEIEDLHSGSS